MINYFQAAERLLEERANLDKAVENMTRRRDRIMQAGRPAELSAIDYGKQYVSASGAADALSSCLDLVEVNRELRDTQGMIREIDEAMGQMEERDAYLLRAWYIQKLAKERIAEEMGYQSTTSVYAAQRRAVARFAILYYGAGAVGFE